MTHKLDPTLPSWPNARRARWLRLCLVLASGGAEAAWVADGKVRLDTYYNDNVTMASTDEDDSVVTRAHAEAELRQVTEQSSISTVAGVNLLNYSDSQAGGEDLDDKDVEYIDLRSRFTAERTKYGLRGTARRDVTLATVGFIRDPIAPGGGEDGVSSDENAEIPGGQVVGDDPTTSGTVDAASVVEQVRRYQIRANPYLEYELSELNTALIGYEYEDQSYEHGEQAGFEDSQSHGMNVALRRKMSERDSARIVMQTVRFDPEQSSKVDSYQFTGGWERGFSEASRGSLDAGVSIREQGGESDTGFVFRLRGSRNSEVGNTFLLLERSLTSNGFGELAETDRLNFGWRRALSDSVHILVRADAYRTTDSNDNDRDYMSAGPELTWSFTPGLSLGATYRYQWVDREGDAGNGATGNSVGIFIAYQPQREL